MEVLEPGPPDRATFRQWVRAFLTERLSPRAQEILDTLRAARCVQDVQGAFSDADRASMPYLFAVCVAVARAIARRETWTRPRRVAYKPWEPYSAGMDESGERSA